MASRINFSGLAFLLLIGFFVATEGAVTKPTKKGKTVVNKGTCYLKNFEKVSTCCKTAPDVFLIKTQLTGCTKTATGTNMAISSSFTINKLQFDNKTIVLGSKGDNLKINKNAFVASDAMDYDKVKEYLKTRITNEYWQTTLDTAVGTCQTAIEAMYTANEALKTVATEGSTFKTCITAPGLLLQCLLGTVYKSCPDASKITTPACLTQLDTFQKCDVFASSE